MHMQAARHPNADKPTRVNVYEVRPKQDGTGFTLASDALANGRMDFTKEHVAVGYAMLHSGSHGSVIRVYDARGDLTASHEQPSARTSQPAN